MSFISVMDYSVSQINPPCEDLVDVNGGMMHIDGFGNYNLSVHGAPGSPLFKEFQHMDGLRNLNFIGFAAFHRDLRS
ncbi:hypothetical protein CCACVL1_21019 [Corchorus capsularis]|uniref:Uncharacterized protein n=1 Tax=Corchorus capsularis TaxID=210143 RepID=A0A1R3H8N9_COCAP|nr:hypothetical protein CCACVL1_21019 [Corchorus capsularis]